MLTTAEAAPVCVIGGINMDISGTPGAPLRVGDSNPGRITMSPGGVGRNIAENLVRLGYRVFLISVLGGDAYANVIREHCGNVGIDLRYCLTDPLGRTSAYLCLNEEDGDLHAAIADMALCDQLTPARLEPLLPELNRSALVFADANVPEETLGWIAEHVTAPLAADPVSVAKAGRLKPLLHRLCMIKPNLSEARLLCGERPEGGGTETGGTGDADTAETHAAEAGRAEPGIGDSPARLAEELRRRGAERVFLSLGARGVWADDRRGGTLLPCIPGPIVNTTGCGDAFAAGAADGFLRGLSTAECARRGLAAAAICAADPFPVSTRLSPEAVDLMLSVHR